MDAARKNYNTIDKVAIAYVRRRITGAIIDYIRRECPDSRMEYNRLKSIEKAKMTMRNDEIAQYLGISDTQLYKSMLVKKIVNFDHTTDPSVQPLVNEEVIDNKRLIIKLLNIVSKLSNMERDVIEKCVMNNDKINKISKEWGVNESRISQVKMRAIERIRENLTLTIYDNKYIDTYKLPKANKNVDENMERAKLINRLCNADNIYIKTDKNKLLLNISNKIKKLLNKKEAKIITMFLFEELSEKEITKKLSISNSHFMASKTIALEKLFKPSNG